MMIVIAVAAVLAMIALPSLRNTMLTNRADTASNQFVAMLALARSEAVKRGTQVNVSSTGGSANWSGGWSVCVTPCAAGSSDFVQNVAPLTAPMINTGTVASVGFDSTGRVVNTATPVRFIFCADGATAVNRLAYGVTVQNSGRARVADFNAAGAPLEEDEATAMTCSNP
jgi:type IV fimbrial biogenesis protein FimT